ncbi:unnamed protein product [Leuciscus chuanchicus]
MANVQSLRSKNDELQATLQDGGLHIRHRRGAKNSSQNLINASTPSQLSDVLRCP